MTMSYHQQTFVVFIYVYTFATAANAVIIKAGTTAAATTATTNSIPTIAATTKTTAATTTTTTPIALRFTQANVINITQQQQQQQSLKDAPQKRNVDLGAAVQQRDSNHAATAVKSYDPPPEYYRGPTTATPTASDRGYAATVAALPNAAVDFHSKTNTIERSRYGSLDGGGGGGRGGGGDRGWPFVKGNGGGLAKQGFNDRISVGHYGSSGNHIGGGGGGGGYDTARPYIVESEHFDYAGGGGGGDSHHHIHYPPLVGVGVGGVGGGAHQHGTTAAGYYATSGGHGSSGPHDSSHSIPFDVYGTRGGGHYVADGGGGGGGVEYPPPYSYAELHEPASHKGQPIHGELSPKALLAKSFLIPLASAAVLGIAAALVSNPLLLQLGTVSAVLPPTAIVGRRKRRALPATAIAAVAARTPDTDGGRHIGNKGAQPLAYRRPQRHTT